MNTSYKCSIYREVLAIIGFSASKEDIKKSFNLNDNETELFLENNKGKYRLSNDGEYSFFSESDYSFTSEIPAEEFRQPMFYYFKKYGASLKELDKMRYRLKEYRGGYLEDFIRFLIYIGEYSENIGDKALALELYKCIAIFSRELPIWNKKKCLVTAILKISKYEFMSGVSPYETLELQHEALQLTTDSNITSEDALLYLYTGVNEHFVGSMSKGATLRKKGVKLLEEFDNAELREEAAPLIIWDNYLLGDFRQTIGCYENYIIPMESSNSVEIFSFVYPPVIFSYFFMGENNSALALGQRIYKRALETNDIMLAILMKASIGRVYIYMDRLEDSEATLKEVYEDAAYLKYGWGMYYALFGLSYLSFKKGNLEGARGYLANAIDVAVEHRFSPINASPFVLEVLKCMHETGLKPIEGYDYYEKLDSYINSKNIHMAGIAWRHRAALAEYKGEAKERIVKMLKVSYSLIEKSGDQHELAKTATELAKTYLKMSDRENTTRYANAGWSLLKEGERAEFPAELYRYVDTIGEHQQLEKILDTAWLEMRYLVNSERLAIRILTLLCRTLNMECGAFFYVSNENLGKEYTQNIEKWPKANNQYNRAEAISIAAARNKNVFLNLDKNNKPMISLALPFVYEDKAVAVLYMESNIEYRKVSETECMKLKSFSDRIGETIYKALRYSSDSDIKSESVTSEYAELLETDTKYCVTKDEHIMQVKDQIQKVAKTNIPVLIIGETGTGKEVFAKSLYERSNYKKSFIKVNCGAIPENLVESELFGYEKGSFTGANTRKKGYFEVAEGGTVFLDEIGELPLLAQVKLLRVLQEHEFMRVGGTESVQVNFRLIAATNKDLYEEVKKGTFREDLYYRLNVITLGIPPLRERKKDIPLLADFFIEKYSKELNLPIRSLNPQSLVEMLEYNWPGNVRELENTIQKAVLFSSNDKISVKGIRNKDAEPESREVEESPNLSAETSFESSAFKIESLLSLEDLEREYIKRVIEICNGKISGVDGAAEVLGLKRTTLISKMKKLGIDNIKN